MPAKRSIALILALPLLVAATASRADLFYTVRFDTSGLTAAMDPGLAVVLTDGSGTDDNNNAVTLGGFSFGGGHAASCATPNNCDAIGGATGDLGSTVTLRDTTFFNAFVQRFTPGGTLAFVLGFSTNLDAGGTPDAFSLSILAGGVPIATLDPLGTDTFLRFDIDSAHPALSVFRSSLDAIASIGAPTVTPRGQPPSGAPEPATASLALFGAIVMLWRRRSTKAKGRP